MTDKAPLLFEARLGMLKPANAAAETAMREIKGGVRVPCERNVNLVENRRLDGCSNTAPSLTKNRERTAIMAASQLPSPVELRQLLSYESETGALHWKERPASMFHAGKQTVEQNQAIWNARFSGKPALASPDKRGYLTGHLFGRPVKAHRVIWALVYGQWPASEIDHIDGNPSNNRAENLRLVSHAINSRNLRRKKNNSTGVCGVFQRPSGRWGAHMQVNGRNITIGTFDTIEEAAAARSEAQRDFGFHKNHGAKR